MTKEPPFQIAEWLEMSQAEQDDYLNYWFGELRPKLIKEAIASGAWPELIDYSEKGGVVDFSFQETKGSGVEAARHAIVHHFDALPQYDLNARKFSRVNSWNRPGETQGEFARAFFDPPHGISKSNEELQALFDKLLKQIFMDQCEFTILDWASPQLGELSDYFDSGFEWWGAFLWTIELPRMSKITVISASATD